MTPLTKATTDAEAAVDQQRARVEKLVAQEKAQSILEAAWSERVTAANTALQAALKAK